MRLEGVDAPLMGYWVYEDRPTNRARVHAGSCRFVINRTLERLPDNEWHGPYETREEANGKALATGRSDVGECPNCLLFRLKLWKTYYNQGFFNVPVAFDKFVRPDEGPVTLALNGGQEVKAQANRDANRNGTARVMGNAPLRDWFQRTYLEGDTVPVRFDTPYRMTLGERADINGNGKNGRTPPPKAAGEGKTETARPPISSGADVVAKARDENGRTPLHGVAFWGERETARALIEAGADTNAQTRDGWVPLHYAADHGATETARALIEAGADINVKTRDGRTPWDIARDREHTDMARILQRQRPLWNRLPGN